DAGVRTAAHAATSPPKSPAWRIQMFAEFIKERQYLQNVSPGTVEWYEESFKWLGNPSPSQADLKAFVVRMRQKGSVEDTGKLAAWKPNKACGSSKPRVLLKRFVPRPLI